MNPVRTLVDKLKAARKQSAAQEEAERLAAQEAVQLELSTLERYARLVEAVTERKRAFETVTSRMELEAQPYTVQSAAKTLCDNWAQLPLVINSLSASQCVAKHKPALLNELELQLIGGAETELRAFQDANSALLQKHGVIP